MKNWEYIAFNAAGKTDSGVIKAETLEEASGFLRAQGLYVRSLQAQDGSCETTTKPNTKEIMFDEVFKEPGELKAEIMEHEATPPIEAVVMDQDSPKPQPKENKVSKDQEKTGSEMPDIRELTKEEKKGLLSDLLRASEISVFLGENGCPEDLQKKINIALIVEAAKRRL